MFFKTVVLSALILHADCYLKEFKDDEVGAFLKPINNGGRPSNYDWRRTNMVSPVKDQRQCNVCWAFSIIANIESHLRIYMNEKEILSEQFLIDCTPNRGCNDEINVLNIFAYIVAKLGGVLRESDYYQYEGQKYKCRWKSNAIEGLTAKEEDHQQIWFYNVTENVDNSKIKDGRLIPVIGFRRVERDEEIIADFVYHYGPITAGINSKSMENYTNGIDEPTDEGCDPNYLNHNVLIVGYSAYIDPDTKKETPYWIIKNSWGTNWGDSGYYYLVRGRNACGIASDLSFAFVN